ncbi:MAG: L,D-transpeptidase, partial [Candidatus Pacebacteria bacterium]|nr:L,D-transpeptidase [Candidatus Paceibacterota bacterium]
KNKAVETDKHIVVDLSKQMLYAYEGNTLFLAEPISAGIEINPTPVGTYTVSRKTPSRYMQGPIPDISDDEYDLPGVPWVLYFSSGGAALHGAYWHNNFGHPMSHGCINQSPELAKKLYYWAPLGTKVIVQR